MCDFRAPWEFKCLYIEGKKIENPLYKYPIMPQTMTESYEEGIYQIVTTGLYYAYTDGHRWWALDWELEGHLIGNN